MQFSFIVLQISRLRKCSSVKLSKMNENGDTIRCEIFHCTLLSSQMKNKGLIKNLNGTAYENHFNANFDIEV